MTLFYDPNSPFYEFSNFYEPKIPFTFNNMTWKNTEAYYQSQKWASPNNDLTSLLTYQQLISQCNTSNKSFILGKAQFVHGLKNKWSLSCPSLLDKGKMTLNEAIAVYTTTPIKNWDNSEQLIKYREQGVKLNIVPLTYDDAWWHEHKVDIMTNIVWLKFTSKQHPALQKLLLNTEGDIREHTSRDLFWADGGKQGGGKNILGQILVWVRNKLNNIESKINLNYCALPLQSTNSMAGSYVKLSNTLYYGIHPQIVLPDIKVDHYISFVEPHEFPVFLNAICFPIQDRKAPTLEYLTTIVDYILTLKGIIYLYCRGGIGRSGTIAAAIYGKINNLNGKQALKHINKEWHSQRDMSYIRPNIIKLGSPQTSVQKNIVKQYLG